MKIVPPTPTTTFISENLPDGSYQVGSTTKVWRFKSGTSAITGLKAVQVSTDAGLGIIQTEIAIGDVAAATEFLVNLPITPLHDTTATKSSYWKFVDGSGAAVLISNSKTGQFWLKIKTNRPPEFSQLQLDSVAGAVNSLLSIPVQATDPDGDTLTYSVLSGGGTVVSGTWQGKAAMLYQHTFAAPGVYPVTLQVSDGHGDTASRVIYAVIAPDGRVANFYTDVIYPGTSSGQSYDQYAAIHYLTLNGITIGRPDPNNPVNRVFEPNNLAKQAEALAMVMKAATLRTGLLLDAEPRWLPNLVVTDVANGIYENFSWAAPYLLKAEALGLIPSADTFNPAAPATRAWLATVVSRLMHLNPPVDLINPAAYLFADAASFSSSDDYDNARAAAFFGYLGHLGDTAIFNPNDAMIRADVAIVTSRILRVPSVEGITTTGLAEQTIYGQLLPSITHGQSFSVSGVINLQAHRMQTSGEDIYEEWIENAANYTTATIINPGTASPVLGEQLVKTLAGSPVIVPTILPDINFSEVRSLLVLLEARDANNNNPVRSIVRLDYGVVFPDADGDGVRDTVDLWPNSTFFSTSSSGNGIPDNANAFWNLSARKSTDTVSINGQSMTLINAILNNVLASDKTAPTTTPSVPGGNYTSAQSITLKTDETATIHCTVDGSTPTVSSPPCSTAIPVSSTMTINYFATDIVGNQESVKQTAYIINTASAGVCGNSNNGTFAVAPAVNLCSVGTASVVSGSGPWSWSCTGINGGSPASCSAIIDATGPTLTVSTLANAAITNDSILNVAGTVFDASGVESLSVNSTTITVTNDSFTHAITLVTGANNIIIVATDKLGNSTTDQRTITLDQGAPSITITAPADNSYTNKTLADINGTVDENATVSISIPENGINQAPTMNGTAFSATVNLANGLNTITVKATDLAGNSSQAKRSITSDVQAPIIAITNPLQDTSTSTAAYMVSGDATDSASPPVTLMLTCDGQTYYPAVVAGTFSQQLLFTTGKQYAVVAIATDAAGNSATAQRNVIYVPKSSGDMNGDGKVDVSDALRALRISVGLSAPTTFELEAGDVGPLVAGTPQPDGVIDVGDAFLLLRKSIGLVTW
ncbi:MAG: hypothetical protein HIU83_05765 [Proteobacteria bacterium]|nr:hypothetical protein [Pseudomonadota bacterium]